MRIGINAGILTGDLTGIARYTISLIRELGKTNHQLFIYLPGNVDVSFLSDVTHHIRFSRFNGRIGKKVWEQLVLPYWCAEDSVDILWSPSHHLPRFISKNTVRVLTVHDLVWVHASETMRRMNRLSEALFMPLSIKSASQIIAVSKQTATDLVEFLPECKNKISVIYCGFTKFETESDLSNTLISPGLKYVLFVGTLEPRKNLKRLLQAYARLPADLKHQYKLVIVGGEGWGNLNVDDVINELGIINNIVVLGYVSDTHLRQLYNNAILLALPSLYEGFGLPLLEAMSIGIPVLTSNISSMPEVVGDAGILVDPYDVNSISNGLNTLLNNKQLRSKLSSLGIKRSLDFSWEKAAKATLDVFECAMSNKN